jgi:hypothetical protein
MAKMSDGDQVQGMENAAELFHGRGKSGKRKGKRHGKRHGRRKGGRK